MPKSVEITINVPNKYCAVVWYTLNGTPHICFMPPPHVEEGLQHRCHCGRTLREQEESADESED